MILSRRFATKKMYPDLHPHASAPPMTDAIEQGMISIKDARHFVNHVAKVIVNNGADDKKKEKEKEKEDNSLSQLQIAGILSTVAVTIPSVVYFIRDDLYHYDLITRTHTQCRDIIEKLRNPDVSEAHLSDRVKSLQRLCYSWERYQPILSKKNQEDFRLKIAGGGGIGIGVVGAIAGAGWIFGGGALLLGAAATYWLYRQTKEDPEKEEDIKSEIEIHLEKAKGFFTE